MEYTEYLSILYRRASASKRKQLRKDPKPCEICGDKNTSVTVDGVWLCDEHMKELRSLQPVLTMQQKLDKLGVAYASIDEFSRGEFKLKQVNIEYKVPFKASFRTEVYDYNGTGKK